jgi:predicted helicase
LISFHLVLIAKCFKNAKNLDIRVIIGNPPYSKGQESANDNNANVSYPHLDERIRSTYAEHSKATNKNAYMTLILGRFVGQATALAQVV